jgi:hypothetical protein
MIVCYAQGGGLGHLTRVRAFLHTVHPDAPATIISASRFTPDPRVCDRHRVLCPPTGSSPTDLSAWITATLDALPPHELVVDAFPRGIGGELSAAVLSHRTRGVTHLARLLRWDVYRSVGPGRTMSPLRFDRTWTLEPLTPDHRTYLESVSAEVEPLDLTDPPPRDDPDPDRTARGAWLVVHSGPESETGELLGYAQDCATAEGIRPRLVLVAPDHPGQLPAGVQYLDAVPAWPLFARAARVITAAGFNAVRQLRPWRSRHRMVPFPRRFDDQFARAARAAAAD